MLVASLRAAVRRSKGECDAFDTWPAAHASCNGIEASPQRPTGSPTRASRRSGDERGPCGAPVATWASVGEPAAPFKAKRRMDFPPLRQA
jgi:hypothetical protein